MKCVKVVHNRKRCIGCNACVTIAPQNWVMDEEEGKSRLIGGTAKGEVFVAEVFECDIEANKEAAAACPVNIIQVND